MPLMDRILFRREKNLPELRRMMRDAGYEEALRADSNGKPVYHFYRTVYQHDYTRDVNNAVPEYCGKATCSNPPPVRHGFWASQRGVPEFHFPAVTPTNQTAAPGGGGRKARDISEAYIPD